ncbi:MAG: DUF4340 domain-containing protein [Candidatus Binatia bacterium]
MTWRSVTVYWLLALVVGGNLYVEWRARNPVQVEVALPVAAIVIIEGAEIDGIVTTRGSLALGIRQVAGRWMLQSPPGLAVQSDLIEALVETVTSIPPVEIIEETGERMAEFGLEPALFTLRLDAGPRTLATIELGYRNPTRTAVYARVRGEARVYLLGLNAQYYVELIYEEVDKQLAGMRRD